MQAARSTADTSEIEHFSRIADEWWDEKGKFRPLHRINPLRIQYIRDALCQHFGKDAESVTSLSGLTLLDIGCGGGLISEPMARLGAHVTGVDASAKNIAVASLHAERMGLTINYLATTPETLVAEQSGAFDVVLALEIVEHVADVDAFIKACAALVRPGGVLIMSTLNRTIKSYMLGIVGAEYVLRWLPVGTHHWKKFLKPSELCEALRRENLHIDDITGMVFAPLSNTWSLTKRDLDVNYLVVASKS